MGLPARDERERIHLLLIDDARRGLQDIAARRTFEADAAVAQWQQRRRDASKATGDASPGNHSARKPG